MFRQLTADTEIPQFDDALVVQQQVHGPQVVEQQVFIPNPKQRILVQWISWICLRCLETVKKNLPNGGLILI